MGRIKTGNIKDVTGTSSPIVIFDGIYRSAAKNVIIKLYFGYYSRENIPHVISLITCDVIREVQTFDRSPLVLSFTCTLDLHSSLLFYCITNTNRMLCNKYYKIVYMNYENYNNNL